MFDVSGIVKVILVIGCGDVDGTRRQQYLKNAHSRWPIQKKLGYKLTVIKSLLYQIWHEVCSPIE